MPGTADDASSAPVVAYHPDFRIVRPTAAMPTCTPQGPGRGSIPRAHSAYCARLSRLSAVVLLSLLYLVGIPLVSSAPNIPIHINANLAPRFLDSAAALALQSTVDYSLAVPHLLPRAHLPILASPVLTRRSISETTPSASLRARRDKTLSESNVTIYSDINFAYRKLSVRLSASTIYISGAPDYSLVESTSIDFGTISNTSDQQRDMSISVLWIPPSAGDNSINQTPPNRTFEGGLVDKKWIETIQPLVDQFEAYDTCSIICVLPPQEESGDPADPPNSAIGGTSISCVKPEQVAGKITYFATQGVDAIVIYPQGNYQDWTTQELIGSVEARDNFAHSPVGIYVMDNSFGNFLAYSHQQALNHSLKATDNVYEQIKLKMNLLEASGPQYIVSLLSPSDPSSNDDGSHSGLGTVPIAITAVCSFLAALILATGVFMCYVRNRRKRRATRTNELTSAADTQSVVSDLNDSRTSFIRSSAAPNAPSPLASRAMGQSPASDRNPDDPFRTPESHSHRDSASIQAPSIFLPHLDPNLAPLEVVEDPLLPDVVARYSYYTLPSRDALPLRTPSQTSLASSSVRSLAVRDQPLNASSVSQTASDSLIFDPTQFPEFVISPATVRMLFGLTWHHTEKESPKASKRVSSIIDVKRENPRQQRGIQDNSELTPPRLPHLQGGNIGRAQSWYQRSSRRGTTDLVYVETVPRLERRSSDAAHMDNNPANPFRDGCSDGEVEMAAAGDTTPLTGSTYVTAPTADNSAPATLPIDAHEKSVAKLCDLDDSLSKLNEKARMKQQELEDDEILCSICLDSFELHQHVRQLPCRHVFHVECIDPWLAAASIEPKDADPTRRANRIKFRHPPVCPMCKTDFSHSAS
ncbi:hypothetical protein H4R35_001444 [Dimargaris xerosporica]|nr:hypothetical protein H4R35_001444 [Dimargaris xerosporica]